MRKPIKTLEEVRDRYNIIDAFYDAWVFAIDHFNDINNNPTK
jgi:hypothetical protein